jgi:hypothetical protein
MCWQGTAGWLSYVVSDGYRNVLRDRTGKQNRPSLILSLIMTAQDLKMASFSRSAVHAVVMNPYSIEECENQAHSHEPITKAIKIFHILR